MVNNDNYYTSYMVSSARIWHLPLLIVLLSFVAPDQTGLSLFGGTTSWWAVSFFIIVCVFWYKKKFFNPSNVKDYRIVHIYLLWMLFGTIRGTFAAEDYWDWKQLVFGSLALSVPIFVYVFSIPEILQKTLKLWLKVIPLAFILYIAWVVIRESYQYYLSPILLLGCFLPIISRKWQIVLLGFLFTMIFADFSARSQIIKAVITLLMSIGYLITKRFTVTCFLKLAHWLCYIVPVVLLFLGISGIFNPFEALKEKNEGIYMQGDEDLAEDTRTFIYEEVISSAVRHNYIWLGRTPARGNDSEVFGLFFGVDEQFITGKTERHYNEVCHPNVFTWIGLIGVILFSFIYLKSSYLSIYKSKNICMKMIGLFIAFRWAYGWIEDNSVFNMMTATLWMMIAMGFSEKFRQMNNEQFKKWVVGVFKSS